MGFIGKALKSGAVLKGVEIVRREAAKPENRRRARELVAKVRARGTKRPR